jgi:8-oxo-dGTP pyrophosphatase MutT (NUDIX family)
MNQTCNNCGKQGHSFYQCKLPITSYGIVAFRQHPESKLFEYLMIRRRDTLGFIDFMRGKYSVYNRDYIMNMLKQMTVDEKQKLLCYTFNELWNYLWGDNAHLEQFSNEENISREKFNTLSNGISMDNTSTIEYSLASLVNDSFVYNSWNEAEWGFPKGRRNYQERDYDCALREFCEETGYNDVNAIHLLKNVLPYEEVFTGSNYKSYKHKYYVVMMKYEDTLVNTDYHIHEISQVEWKTFADCIKSIRYYNLEKMKVLEKINKLLLVCGNNLLTNIP